MTDKMPEEPTDTQPDTLYGRTKDSVNEAVDRVKKAVGAGETEELPHKPEGIIERY